MGNCRSGHPPGTQSQQVCTRGEFRPTSRIPLDRIARRNLQIQMVSTKDTGHLCKMIMSACLHIACCVNSLIHERIVVYKSRIHRDDAEKRCNAPVCVGRHALDGSKQKHTGRLEGCTAISKSTASTMGITIVDHIVGIAHPTLICLSITVVAIFYFAFNTGCSSVCGSGECS